MTDGADLDIVALFKQGFETVTRFPILILPPLAFWVLLVLVMIFVWGGTVGLGAVAGGAMGGSGGAAAGGALGFVVGGLLFMMAATFLSLLASGVVVLMANDALAGREPSIGGAIGGVVARAGDVILASFLVSVIVGIGIMVLVVPGLIAAFLLLFTLPAVLLDAQGAVNGLKRSFGLVKANVGAVLGFVVGAILAAVGAGFAGWIVGHLPIIGPLAVGVLHGALISYLTVVGVRLYQVLPRR